MGEDLGSVKYDIGVVWIAIVQHAAKMTLALCFPKEEVSFNDRLTPFVEQTQSLSTQNRNWTHMLVQTGVTYQRVLPPR